MRKKSIIIMAIAALLVGTVAAVTVSYISKSSTLSNSFTTGTINPVINETFDNTTKEDVYISNSGNSPMYVRVAILYSFIRTSGSLLSDIPVENTDYTVSLSSSTNWLHGSDGYYYYKLPLNENEDSDILVDEIRNLANYDDKRLDVDILVQGIQAEPSNAVREAWNVNVNDGVISLRN